MRLLAILTVSLVLTAVSCATCSPSGTTCQSDSDCAIDERCDGKTQICVVIPSAIDASRSDVGSADAAARDGAGDAARTDAYTTDATVADTGPRYRASAGPDQQVALDALVQLSASATVLPPGASDVVYHWAFVNRPTSSTTTIDHFDMANATFVASDPHANYQVELEVTADGVALASDQVAIAVLNTAPRANAGDDVAISIGTSIELDGTASTDDDGDSLNFDWSILAPDNGATLTNIHWIVPQFVSAAGFSGSTTVQLAVSDLDGAIDTDTVVVTTENLPPHITLANTISVPHEFVGAGMYYATATVALDATVVDPEGDSFTVVWNLLECPDGPATSGTCPSGLVPTFSAPTAASTDVTFRDDPILRSIAGQYQIEIIATDAGDHSARQQVAVTVENRAPIGSPSSASAAHTFSAGQYRCEVPFALEVSDPEGDPLWVRLQVDPSAAVGHHQVDDNDLTAISPTLTAALLGPYVVTATVSDHQGASIDVTVTITCSNATPTATVTGATTIPHRYQNPIYVADISLVANPGDTDGDPTRCTWTVPDAVSGVDYSALPTSGIMLDGPIRSAAGQVIATHGFRANCTDGLANAVVDHNITVTNSPPVVEAGAAVTTAGHTYVPATSMYEALINLSTRATPASVNDVNGDPVSLTWTLLNPVGNVNVSMVTSQVNPEVAISGSTAAIRAYSMQLSATDSLGSTASDTTTLTVTNRIPVVAIAPELRPNRIDDNTPCGYKGVVDNFSFCQILGADKGGGAFSYSTDFRVRVTDDDGDPLTGQVTPSGSANNTTIDGHASPVLLSGNGSVSLFDVPIVLGSVYRNIGCDSNRTHLYHQFTVPFWYREPSWEDSTTIATSVTDSLGATPSPAPQTVVFTVRSTSQHQECQ